MIIERLKKLYHNDPILWRSAIHQYRKQDRQQHPERGGILFTGSSTIRFWESLERDMAPYPVLNRGFGGSMMHQVVHYMRHIVFPYQPSAIFLYAGENDIAGMFITRRHPAEEVHESFREFCESVHRQLPATLIHYISIKPAKSRKKYWPEMQRSNEMIRDYCASDARLRYVDIVPSMLRDGGAVRTELFRRDGIHLNEQGYAVWTSVIRPVVEELCENELRDALQPLMERQPRSGKA